jgi:hypothetical protein
MRACIRLLALALLAASGCFYDTGDLGGAPFKCSHQEPGVSDLCPDNYVCSNRITDKNFCPGTVNTNCYCVTPDEETTGVRR